MKQIGVSKVEQVARWSIIFSKKGRILKSDLGAVRLIVNEILKDRAFSELPTELCQISITFCGDRYIQTINSQYRGKDKPTDVLSFPAYNFKRYKIVDPVFSPSLGDLVISIDTTIRQSKSYRVTPSNELIRLLVHGLLHLAGYDHEKVLPKEAQKMRRAEKRIMRKLSRLVSPKIKILG